MLKGLQPGDDPSFQPYAPALFPDADDISSREVTDEQIAKWNQPFKRKVEEDVAAQDEAKLKPKRIKLAPTESKEKRAAKMRETKQKKIERLAVIAAIAAGSAKGVMSPVALPPPVTLPRQYNRPDEKSAKKLAKQTKPSTLDSFLSRTDTVANSDNIQKRKEAKGDDDDGGGDDNSGQHSSRDWNLDDDEGESGDVEFGRNQSINDADWFNLELPDGEIVAVLRSDPSIRKRIRHPTNFQAEWERHHAEERKSESEKVRDARIELAVGMSRDAILARWRHLDRVFSRKPSPPAAAFRRQKAAYFRLHYFIPFDFDTNPIFGSTPHSPQTTEDRIIAACEWRERDDVPERSCMLEPRRPGVWRPDFCALSQLPILTMTFLPPAQVVRDNPALVALAKKAPRFFRHRNFDQPLVLEHLPPPEISSFGHSAVVLWRMYRQEPERYQRFRRTYQTEWNWRLYLSYSDRAKLARVCRSFRVEFGHAALFTRPLRVLAATHPTLPRYEIELAEHAIRVLLFLVPFTNEFRGHVGELREWLLSRGQSPPPSFPPAFGRACKMSQFFSPETKRREFILDEKQVGKITPTRAYQSALVQLESLHLHLKVGVIIARKTAFERDGYQMRYLRQFCNMKHGALPLARKSKTERQFTETVGDCVYWPSDCEMKFSVANRTAITKQTRKFFYLSVLSGRHRLFCAVNFDTGEAYCDVMKCKVAGTDDDLLLIPLFKILTDERPARLEELFPRLDRFFPRRSGDGKDAKVKQGGKKR